VESIRALHNVRVTDADVAPPAVEQIPSLGAVEGFVAWLRAAPEDGGRSILGALVRFGITGLASVAVDVGVLAGLHSAAGAPLALATLAGYALGVVVNYSLNRNWTFKSERDHRQTLIRYSALLVVNVAITEGVVLALTHVGVYYLLSKLVAVAIIAVLNFFVGRHWVFAN
jgi:putative flippase GtrA